MFPVDEFIVFLGKFLDYYIKDKYLAGVYI